MSLFDPFLDVIDAEVGDNVGPNLLLAGSKWYASPDDETSSLEVRPFHKIKAAVNEMAPADFPKGHVKWPRSDKTRITGACATRSKGDEKGLSADEISLLCPFRIEAKHPVTDEFATITKVCLDHSNDCNLENGRQRRHSISSILKGGSSVVLNTTKAPPPGVKGSAYQVLSFVSINGCQLLNVSYLCCHFHTDQSKLVVGSTSKDGRL